MIVNDRLPNSLPFLMSRIVAKLMEQCRDYYELGLSVPEARTLIVVLENPGIRVGRLAEMTSIELSTLSHMLSRLARSGFITRVRPETDSRSVTIGLTPTGRATALQCEAASIRHEEMLVKSLDTNETKVFRKIIRKVADSLNGDHLSRDNARPGKDGARTNGKLRPTTAKKSTRPSAGGGAATQAEAGKKALSPQRRQIRQAR